MCRSAGGEIRRKLNSRRLMQDIRALGSLAMEDGNIRLLRAILQSDTSIESDMFDLSLSNGAFIDELRILVSAGAHSANPRARTVTISRTDRRYDPEYSFLEDPIR